MSLLISDKEHPAESTHWYTRDGIPAYSTLAKNGTFRSTTLRDARTSRLLPSVTTITKSASSPGLENWKLEQMLMAALTLPRISDEPTSDFMKRVRHDSREHGRMAAARGTAIHTAVEGHYRGDKAKDYQAHVQGAKDAIAARYGLQQWIPEKSFGSEYGFGGKVDLCCEKAVIDIKSKEFDEDSLPKGFDENLMQLAAYRVGLGVPHSACANVFVSVTNPGLIHIVEWTEEDLQRGWKMFCGLLNYWYAKTMLDVVRIPV